MSRRILTLLLPWLVLWLCPASLAAQLDPTPSVEEGGAKAFGATVVRVEGELDLAHQALFVRGIAAAKRRGDKLVVELDTPGGEVQLAWTMARLLDEAGKEGVHVVAWVNDHALSAGALLALACKDIYMRGTASFGAAQVIQMMPGLPMIQGVSPDDVVEQGNDEDVEEKYGSTWRASFRAFAQEHGRPAVVAEAMVDRRVTVRLVKVGLEERIVGESEWDDLRYRGDDVKLIETVSDEENLLNLTPDEAVRLRMSEGRADELDAVLAAVGIPGAAVSRLAPTQSEELAAWLHRIGPLLWVLGFMLAFAELKAPGFGVPGLLAAACFGALLFGRYMVGLAEIVHVVLIAAGMILLAVELLLVPGTIWVGLTGGLCVVCGLGWSIADSGGGFDYGMDRRLALDGMFYAALWSVAALAAVLLLSRLLPRTPLYAKLAVAPADPRAARASALPEAEGRHAAVARVGAEGVALTDLRPVGKVVLDGAQELEFEGRSTGPEIERGVRVVVREAQAGRLVVEALPGGPAGGRVS